ncbi:MAG: zinc ribbon domain-containing protein [Ruminococcaceae bacterium]|nr:zinc ribbon domain-containing protein [Oscillospiraceae bacterium]
MAFCANCGLELEQGANFCTNCGKAIGGKNQTLNQVNTTYDGVVHKCPNCGEVLNSFVSLCPTCHFELRDASVTSSVRELSLKLEQIGCEKNYTNRALNPLKTLSRGFVVNKTSDQQVNLIRSFSIPNTKEDIIEFMILASSNIDIKLYGFGDRGVLTASQREISDAWLAKFEQSYEKAKLVLSGEDLQTIHNIYEKTQRKLKLEKLKVPLSVILPFAFVLLIAGFCLIMAQFE